MKKSIIATLSLLLISSNLYAKEPENIILCYGPEFLEAAHLTYKKHGDVFLRNIRKITKEDCFSLDRINTDNFSIKIIAVNVIRGNKYCSIEAFIYKSMKEVHLYAINTEEAPVCEYFK